MKTNILIVIVTAILLAGSTTVGAADKDREQTQQQDRYGWEMMTSQERTQHMATMHNLKTAQEREAYRQQHHTQMQQRAKERGVTLPDMPGYNGQGMGGGMGQGMGPGMGGGRR